MVFNSKKHNIYYSGKTHISMMTSWSHWASKAHGLW